MNIKKHFTIALFYSVLTLGMFFGLQYIFAWTNPTLSPPSGNISPPINEGTTAQVKDGSLGVSGNLTAPIFYDVNNTGYYIDPAGTSKFNNVNLGGESRNSWPSGDSISSGAIMAFDLTSCPSGWTELTSARGRVIVGLNPGDGNFDSRGETGGEKNHVLTIDEIPGHSHSSAMMSFVGADGVVMAHGSGGQGWNTITGAGHLTTLTGGSQAHNNLQPYISFIYCRKD